MNDIQDKIAELQAKGWTLAAIADETENHVSTLEKWKSGAHYPNNVKFILLGLDSLLQRKRIPKQRRYVPGSRKRDKSGADSE